VKLLVSAGIGLAALVLATGAASNAAWVLAAAPIALGALWLVGVVRGWDWMGAFSFVSLMSLAALGMWLRIAPMLMLVGAVAALIAWDLDGLGRRMRSARRVEGGATLVRAHLQRLAAVAGLGLLLGGIALGIHIRLSFGWALVLGLLAILGLSRGCGSAIRSATEHRQ